MVNAIAEIIKSRLSNLTWIERLGGLVVEARRPETRTGENGQQIIVGYQTYPVACDTSAEACWNNGVYKHFEPDSGKAAIAFFTDQAGVSFVRNESPKLAFLVFGFELRLLFWLNLKRLGDGITGGGCNVSGLLAPYVCAQLFGHYPTTEIEAVFDDTPNAGVFNFVDVRSIRELPKTPAMFRPFSFADYGDNRALFLYPYDYFGVVISGQFVINKNCLPEFPAFEAVDEYCIEQ